MRKKSIWMAIGIIFLTIFLRLPYVYEKILNLDEANFTIVAREILKGKLIYKDIIDTRPPLGYIIYLGVELLNRKNTLLGIHLFGLLWIILTTLVVIKVGNYVYKNNMGYVAGFFYSIFSMGYYPYDMVAVNAEIFMLLPLVLSFLFFSYYIFENKKIYCFLSSLMTGFCFLFKQTGIYNFLPVFGISIYLVIQKNKNISQKTSFLKEIFYTSFISVSGFFLPFLITIIYFAFKNGLDSFIYANFILGQKYVKAVSFKTGLYRNVAMSAHFIIPNFLFFGLAICGFFTIFSKNFKKSIEQNTFIIFIFLESLISFFGAYTGRRPIAHYYIPVFPSLVLLATYGFLILKNEIISIHSEIFKLFYKLIILLGILNSFFAFHDISNFLERWKYILLSKFKISETADEVISFIKENTKNEDKIFVWGYSPEIYLWANRSPASRFFIPDVAVGLSPGGERFTESNENIEKMREIILNDLKENKPFYIIDTSLICNFGYENFPLEKISVLWQFIENEYILEKEIGKIKIYRKKLY